MVADIAPLKAIYSPGTRVARSILVMDRSLLIVNHDDTPAGGGIVLDLSL